MQLAEDTHCATRNKKVHTTKTNLCARFQCQMCLLCCLFSCVTFVLHIWSRSNWLLTMDVYCKRLDVFVLISRSIASLLTSGTFCSTIFIRIQQRFLAKKQVFLNGRSIFRERWIATTGRARCPRNLDKSIQIERCFCSMIQQCRQIGPSTSIHDRYHQYIHVIWMLKRFPITRT